MARKIITEVTHSGPYVTFTGKRWNRQPLSVTVHASAELGTGTYKDGRGMSLRDQTTGKHVLFSQITPEAECAAYLALGAARASAGTPTLTTHLLRPSSSGATILVCLEYPDGTQATHNLPHSAAVLCSGRLKTGHPPLRVTVFYGCPITYPTTRPMFTAHATPEVYSALAADLHYLPDAAEEMEQLLRGSKAIQE